MILSATELPRKSDRTLRVNSQLKPLFPHGGLIRGSLTCVTNSMALLAAVLTGTTAPDVWLGVVGLPHFNALAAAQRDVLSRCAFIPDTAGHTAEIIAALLDGVDCVAFGNPDTLDHSALQRLRARARQRDAVLLSYGECPSADYRLSVTDTRWTGMGDGHGRLRVQQATVELSGRRVPLTRRLSCEIS